MSSGRLVRERTRERTRRHERVDGGVAAHAAEGISRLRLAEDEVRAETEEEAEQKRPRDQRLVAELAVDVHQLDHDVQDRAGREREEPDLERLADERLADERAEERRPAADQPEQREETPGRPATPTPDIGATMPKPSVALCSPKPITRSSASDTSSCAADWPIARPSEKLCRPIPVAISSASQLAG